MSSLFAHLATRFASSPENIAIEALAFVLQQSPAARSAMRELIGLGSPLPLPEPLSFATQAGNMDDAARPDIEAYRPDLVRSSIIECKFWAGLTENQPLTYAARLSAEVPGSLVFIVPSARLTALWGELTGRLVRGGYRVGRRHFRGQEIWHTGVGLSRSQNEVGGVAVALGSATDVDFGLDVDPSPTLTHGFSVMSWRAVIASLRQAMEAAGEATNLPDLDQLAGLCERMDEEAFLPLRSEELTSIDLPRRTLQLAQLATEIGTALIDEGVAEARSPDGRLTTAGGPGWYGRYLYAQGVVFFLLFDCSAWLSHNTSPLWLKIDAQRFPHAAANVLRRAEQVLSAPAISERNQWVLLPVPVATAVEKPKLIDEAVSFCTRAIALFADRPASPPASEAA